MNDEIIPEEFEPADVMCNDCTVDLIQIEAPREKPPLFTKRFYVKWLYHCQKCGKQSKIFCSKMNNKVQ